MNASMNRILRWSWKPLAGIVGMAGLMVYSSGGCTEKVPPGTVAVEPGEPMAQGAATVVVRRAAIDSTAEVPGTVESETKILLSAKMPAHVKKVFVSAGTAVRAGQELVLLDDRETGEQLAAAEAQLRMAEAEYNRTKSLFEAKAATEQQRLAAETGRDAAKAQVERARVMMTYARIVSPINGVVTDRRVEEGDLTSPGQVLLAVYDPSRMRLEAPVPMRLAGALSAGMELGVTLADPDRSRKGRITEIVSEIDPQSRTQKVRVLLEDPSGLRPGAFGRLLAPAGKIEVIRVPETAVMRVGQLETVRVVRDGRSLRRLVKTGASRDGQVEVLSGLDDGETVLVAPGGRRASP
jgi:RND family efflux transporter MFP subunit